MDMDVNGNRMDGGLDEARAQSHNWRSTVIIRAPPKEKKKLLVSDRWNPPLFQK